MIRIVHVITGLEQGGAEAMLTRLLLGFDREVFDQRVVSLTDRGVFGNMIEAAGIPLATLGMKGLHTLPRTLLALRRTIAAHRPHIVQTWLYHADFLGLIAARSVSQAAVVWNIRCAGLAPGDVPRPTRWLIWLLARLSHWPEAILYNSVEGEKAHRAIGYHPHLGLTIPNGFDLAVWRPDSRQRVEFRAEVGIDTEAFVVGMVARYHRMKDHKTFLAAAALMRERMPGIRFVLIGRDIAWSNDELVANINRFGLRDTVVLLGPRQDVPRVVNGIDCLVSTSTSEGFPNVLGEAMACGVPCVATDVGDSRLIVGDTGCLVAVGDAAAIVAAIENLAAADPETKADRSTRCRKRIADNFRLDGVVARYEEFLRRLVARDKGIEREA